MSLQRRTRKRKAPHAPVLDPIDEDEKTPAELMPPPPPPVNPALRARQIKDWCKRFNEADRRAEVYQMSLIHNIMSDLHIDDVDAVLGITDRLAVSNDTFVERVRQMRLLKLIAKE